VRGRTIGGTPKIDLAVYVGCALFAGATALWSEFYGYRVWGNFATIAYLLAAAHAAWLIISPVPAIVAAGGGAVLRSRWAPIVLIVALGMVAPLGLLVVRRLTGVDWLITPVSWAAQPEVWVIERSADLLLRTGTPYLDVTALGRPAEVNDYTPYGPAMTVFGLPRALLGGGPVGDALTDARLMFAMATVLTVTLSLRLLRWPSVPVGAAQLAIVCPLTALNWAVAGPDLAITGLVILACALLVPRPTDTPERPASTPRTLVWSAVVLAVTVSMKLTALPTLVVLGCFVLATRGAAALGRYLGTFLIALVAVTLPIALVDPAAFVEHVIRFPIGLGVIDSPAGSALPGHLLASTGPLGRVLALALLGAAALAITAWLVVRPPTTGSDAMLRIAVGLGTATVLMPASRWGYLVYPLALLGAMSCFSAAERTSRAHPDRRPAVR